ncbi:SdrD B-like domain-containing protein [Paracoccus sphaerophysae]|uniref:SD-repeat containing protein B domain-containing protein n=1 Tax=Paracoccus sphaerophysae TaxID=690417 RepID=A0A099FAN0_9RHOB|nr:SdrD B-like domain-containing protein [Paracoccus sphaerophysae]KGJ07266.1 hypothetical protein IC63_08870 [Paracoccus sphaerophysae]
MGIVVQAGRVLARCRVVNKCLTVNVCDVNEPTTPGQCTVIEVEDMTLCGYNVRGASSASGGEYATLACYSGTARTMFNSTAGEYDLTLRHYDQSGAGQVQIMINGQVVRTVSLNADDNRWHDTVIADLQLKPGDVITLKGSGTGCEYAILDSIRLCPSEPVDPGTAALGDRVFHDTNRNGVQDAGEAGVAGVAVTLYDAAGQAIGSTVTDANGNYLFDDLKAGTYSVGFQEADGFDFTTRDAGGNDARDSDANQTTGRTGSVTLSIGETNTTVDAGLVRENAAPVAVDDQGRTCADTPKAVDVLANNQDPDGDALTITSVDGKAISEGQTITASDGVLITLTGGRLVFDASGTTYADGLVHTSVTANYGYTVADGQGSTAAADVSMRFCGTVNTLDTIADSLPAGGSMVIDFSSAPNGSFFTATLSGTGDARFDGVSVGNAYCVSIDDPIGTGVPIAFDMYLADAAHVPAGVVPNPQNLDVINWILNQDFTRVDNGDGNGRTYTEAEIQGAIWGLTDGRIFVAPYFNYATTQNAQEIYDLALANGEGFVAGEGDLVGLILDPTDAEAANGSTQPFIIAMPWEALDYDCVC